MIELKEAHKVLNQRRGHKSQAFGALFEEIFLRTCRTLRLTVTRFPDGCRQVHGKLIRIRTPWDWILTYLGKSAFLDTKTLDGITFTRSHIVDHQVEEMVKHQLSGSIAGYVIWLRASNVVFFMDAVTLIEIRDSKTVSSFNQTHPKAMYLGTSEGFNLRSLFGS